LPTGVDQPTIIVGKQETHFSGRITVGQKGPGGISHIFVALMAILSALLMPSRMLLDRGAPNDSAVFAYVGWAMNHGLAPYRDVWDHKGPLLYYLQFAGVRLFPKSTFGIGLLESLALFGAFFLLYTILNSFASGRVSAVTSVACVFFLARFAEGGNLCESWALLPLATAHYASWRGYQRTSLRWCASVLGACFACIIWLRPNMATFPVVALLILLYRKFNKDGLRAAVSHLAVAAATALGVTCLVLLPIIRFHVFHEFVGAYFGYNAAYSGSPSILTRLRQTTDLLLLLFSSRLAILAAPGWTFALQTRKLQPSPNEAFPTLYVKVLLWTLPLEIVAACLAGRDYPHYLLPLLPTLAVLAGSVLAKIESMIVEATIQRAVIYALAVGLFPVALAVYVQNLSDSTNRPMTYRRLADFVRHTTASDDEIIVVGGAEAAYVTYYSQRMPASRYVYQYSLVHSANPEARAQREQFLRDLVANRPAVIISTNPAVGLLCSSDLECRGLNKSSPLAHYGYDSQVLPQLLRPLLESEYRLVQDGRLAGMRVFVRRDVIVPAEW
jgi:hypothetical protein